MHLKSPIDKDDTQESEMVPPGAVDTPPVTPASRSPSVDLAEMDSIVNTQDDVVRRYVGLRDGLENLEREVSIIRTLNRGSGYRGGEQVKYEAIASDEEDIDR